MTADKSKRAHAPGSVGRVVQTDRRTIVVAVETGQSLRYREFLQIPFERSGETLTLVAQVELLVGDNVKIGSTQRTGNVSLFGIGVDVVETTDIAETEVRATARVITFLDSKGSVLAHDPTIEYMGHEAFHAEPDNLRRVYSFIDRADLVKLEVGTLLGSQEVVPVAFDPSGLMRHTAVFGQSGSGKSYSFGIILEELLYRTTARVIVLDPNGDYRQFGAVRTRATIQKGSRREYSVDDHEAFQTKWKPLSAAFLQFSPHEVTSPNPLRLYFSDLRRNTQAQLLGIDPVVDREEFAAFRETVDALPSAFALQQLIDALSRSPSIEKVRLLYRIKNRELDKMALWGGDSMIAKLSSSPWRFASVDLGDVSSAERWLTAEATLEGLYRAITRTREVTFFVIDEAHNFCPATPWDPRQEGPRQVIHEIAAEGRKYGAFLILLTQSPSKVSSQALHQCDNLILMKMTSGAEVRTLEAMVEDGGSRLAQIAFKLSKGEALCFGGFVRGETGVKFDLRRTTPGGDDVSTAWAKA